MRRNLVVDVVIVVIFYALFVVLPISDKRTPAAEGDPNTLAGAVIFGYVAMIMAASHRWDSHSFILSFLASRPGTLWGAFCFGLIALYAFLVWW
jgi:hypothetical protein